MLVEEQEKRADSKFLIEKIIIPYEDSEKKELITFKVVFSNFLFTFVSRRILRLIFLFLLFRIYSKNLLE